MLSQTAEEFENGLSETWAAVSAQLRAIGKSSGGTEMKKECLFSLDRWNLDLCISYINSWG